MIPNYYSFPGPMLSGFIGFISTNSLPSGTTMIQINNTDFQGIDISNWNNELSAATGPNKGYLRVSTDGFSNNYAIYRIDSLISGMTGPTEQYTLAVTYISGNGPTVAPYFPAVVSFSRSGDLGPQGNQGFQGDQGPLGVSSGQIYYFNQSVTQTPLTYKQIGTLPTAGSVQTKTVTTTGTTPVLVQTYITDASGLGVNVIPPGAQKFHLHFLKGSIGYNTDAFCTIQLADSTGTPYPPPALPIQTNQVLIGWIESAIPVECYVDLVIPASYQINPTDRMIVNVYVVDQSNGNHPVTFYTEGSQYYSYVTTSLGIEGTQGVQGTQGFQGDQGNQGPQGNYGIGYSLTSNDGIIVSTGTKTFTVNLSDTNSAFIVGQRVRIQYSTTAYMDGYITTYSGTSMSVSVDALGSTNIGWNLSPWIVLIVGVNGVDGSDGPQGNQGDQGPAGLGSTTNLGLVQAMTQGLQNIF